VTNKLKTQLKLSDSSW